MKMLQSKILCVMLIALSACSFGFGGGSAPRQYYLLTDQHARSDVHQSPLPVRLVVRETLASPFIYSQRIIFMRETEILGEYQTGYWSEPPPRRFTTLLLLRFAENDNYQTVSREASSTIGDVEVNTDLVDFVHDASLGRVRVVVSAELVRTKQRKALTRRIFRVERDVTDDSLDRVINDFAHATGDVITQITAWTDEEVTKARDAGLLAIPNNPQEQS